MASKVKKGVLYYIAWVVFLTLGIFCIFSVILIFNPGKDVFGISFRYVSDNNTTKYNTVNVGGADTPIKQLAITDINVNAGFTDIQVKTVSEYENITIMLDKNIVGFSSSKNVTYIFDMSYENNQLNINITEPELSLKLAPNATLTIFCPKGYSFENYNLNINTTSGDIYIGTSDGYDLNAKQLNLVSKSGKIKVRGLTNISSGIVNIETETSNIDIYANIKSELNIETKSSKIYIEKIEGNLNVKADELKAKCDKILGNITFSSSKGYITVDELGNLATKSGGNFVATADSMHIANVTINKMAGDVSLPNAEKSDITINELYGDAYVNTTSGRVKLGKCYGLLTIETTSGAVTFTQASAERTDVKTLNGKIVGNFNQISVADLKTERANIEVNFNADLRIVINYNSAKDISASWITTTLEKSGTVLTPNTDASSDVVMNITTEKSGSILISNKFIMA